MFERIATELRWQGRLRAVQAGSYVVLFTRCTGQLMPKNLLHLISRYCINTIKLPYGTVLSVNSTVLCVKLLYCTAMLRPGNVYKVTALLCSPTVRFVFKYVSTFYGSPDSFEQRSLLSEGG